MLIKYPLPHAATHARELRKKCTEAEIVLWEKLRNRKFHGLKFRRQSPVGRFIADFLCTQPPLIIELDGGIHLSQKEADAYRTEAILDHFDIPVLRLSNDEVLKDLPLALTKIELFLFPPPHSGAEAPPLSLNGREEVKE